MAYFILSGLIGYLVADLFFAGLVLAISLFLSIFIFFFGDRLILAAINARGALVSRDLWRRANNMSARLGLGTIYLYSAPFLNPNIYFLQSGMGRASLVFGGGIEEKLSQEELDLVIYASLKIIKIKEARAKMLVSFGHYFLALPHFALKKIKPLAWLGTIYEFLAMPGQLMNKLVLNYLNMSVVDKEVGLETEQNRELAGSIYKIGTLSGRNATFIQKYIMNSLTYADNKRDENDFRLNGQDGTSLRFQNLISEK
ncbi:hypothetical protein M899_3454 [Bacteriovorax sp. BSW11_IV]|uniref:hypothetical protein n=1 Tax=Bacteriovorax sp. BSW11_IV TaxID=1353529 RepID=UPI000389DC32|nr:hypothetical protein [Bacteriovorax sp. BSW11_IV]EQC45113.1 hypothetical protein M899_3454 [Bacteriovorax sp. BSW11_IV]